MTSSLINKAVSAVTPSDPWIMLLKMSSAQKDAASYRSKMTFNNSGQQMDIETELLCPGREHMKMTQSSAISEITIIDGMQYISSGRTFSHQGPTQKIASCPGGGAHSSFSLSDLKDLEKYKQNAKFEKGGTESVEGNSCQDWTLTYNDPDSARSGS